MAGNTGVSTESLAIETKKKSSGGPKLKIAVIGCGGIAQAHMGIWRKMDDVEIVAGVDIVPERLDNFKDKWGVTALYKDWKKMHKEVKPDAVDVCTPNGVHAPAVIDSLNFGCHAMTEKPMAMTPKECQNMIKAAEKSKKKLVVGFQYRYHPNTQIIRRAVEAGMLGNIMYVKCRALRRRGIPNWGVFGQKHLQGGGPMIDIGVHVIEMAHYTIGSPNPVLASGNTWTYLGNKPSDVMSQWPGWDYKTYTVEDLAIGQIRFDTGAIMQIEASFAAHIEKDVWDYTIIGDKGGANWESGTIFTDQAGTMVNSSPSFVSDGGFNTLFGSKQRNFVDGILYGKKLMAPGEAGLAVQKIIDGVYRSAAAGKEVKIA